MPPRLIRLFIFAIACLAPPCHAQSRSIAEATNRIAAELEKGPRLELPPLSPEEAAVQAPEAIRSAGEEYVAAWKLTRRWSLATAPPVPKPERDKVQPAAGKKDLDLDHLVKRTLEDNPPPALEDYSAVFSEIYESFKVPSDQFCGQDSYELELLFDSLLALRSLRIGDYLTAYRHLDDSSFAKARASILRAYGIDLEDILIGSWLHGNSTFDLLRPEGKEKSASMLLKWAEMRWKQMGKQAVRDHELKLPAFPDQALISFLKPGNGVSDETKGKISQFLATAGVQLRPVSYWLKAMPDGGDAWMVPLAKLGLSDELNLTRKKASAILTKAGVAHEPPAMVPAPKLRVTVNGGAFPKELAQAGNSRGKLIVTLPLGERSSRDCYAWLSEEGLFELHPDELAELSAKAATIKFPRNYLATSSPAEPFLNATLPLPLKPGETRTVDFKSVAATIRPVLPAGRRTPARLMEIEFGPAAGESSPRGSLYHLKSADELVLPYVSPGEYWLRIRHPGTALMPWTKVQVSPDKKLLAPRLKAGSTLVVPLAPAKPEIPASWPPQLVDGLGLERGDVEHLVQLWRDGTQINEWGPTPEGTNDHFPHSAIFGNLPPGDYEVRARRIPTSTPSLELIEPRSFKVRIREDSPVYQLTEPFELKLNPLPEEKAKD